MKPLNLINNLKQLRRLSKFTPLLILVVAAILIWIFEVHSYISLDTLNKHQTFLQEYVRKNQLLSVTIYCLLYFAIVSLSIPVATIMTLIAMPHSGLVQGKFPRASLNYPNSNEPNHNVDCDSTSNGA